MFQTTNQYLGFRVSPPNAMNNYETTYHLGMVLYRRFICMAILGMAYVFTALKVSSMSCYLCSGDWRFNMFG